MRKLAIIFALIFCVNLSAQPLSPQQMQSLPLHPRLILREGDVQRVIDSGICAAALIYAPPTDFNPEDSRVKIAFDADAVIFSDESECRFKEEGFDAFYKYEKENADVPLKEGPFANLLKKLSAIRRFRSVCPPQSSCRRCVWQSSPRVACRRISV